MGPRFRRSLQTLAPLQPYLATLTPLPKHSPTQEHSGDEITGRSDGNQLKIQLAIKTSLKNEHHNHGSF